MEALPFVNSHWSLATSFGITGIIYWFYISSAYMSFAVPIQRDEQNMQLSSYPLRANAEATTFEFFSNGPRGTIAKIIQFHPTETPNLYNLSFGDLNPTSGEMNDRSRSNNGDHEIVLATIVSAVLMFTDCNPNAWIYAKGSTLSRTRLYQMGIARYRERAMFEFHILAKTPHQWEEFTPGKNYFAFLVFRRKNTITFNT